MPLPWSIASRNAIAPCMGFRSLVHGWKGLQDEWRKTRRWDLSLHRWLTMALAERNQDPRIIHLESHGTGRLRSGIGEKSQ